MANSPEFGGIEKARVPGTDRRISDASTRWPPARCLKPAGGFLNSLREFTVRLEILRVAWDRGLVRFHFGGCFPSEPLGARYAPETQIFGVFLRFSEFRELPVFLFLPLNRNEPSRYNRVSLLVWVINESEINPSATLEFPKER